MYVCYCLKWLSCNLTLFWLNCYLYRSINLRISELFISHFPFVDFSFYLHQLRSPMLWVNVNSPQPFLLFVLVVFYIVLSLIRVDHSLFIRRITIIIRILFIICCIRWTFLSYKFCLFLSLWPLLPLFIFFN